jgi:parvulin-like peptidyl-prolyl isomerase
MTRRSLNRCFSSLARYASIQDVANIMRRVPLLLLIVLCADLAGCNGIQKKHDNPVMVQAPRRVDRLQSDETEAKYADNSDENSNAKEVDGSDITLVRSTLETNPWKNWNDDTTIFNSQVAATVNGAPILNGDVLDRYAGYLISVRDQMQELAKDPKKLQPGQPLPTPESFVKFRQMLIQRDIATHIQKKLLVERMKGSLKPDQMKQMNSHIDQLFEKETERLKKDLNVTNKTELELELNKKGTTLQNVKDNFALERLSVEFLVAKSEKPDPIERPDLVAYYQSNTDKFSVEAKVKWQQLQVSITPETNKSAARAKLDQALAELNHGVSFDKVAKKYSDGPTAKEGGAWDWMEAGNLADEKLEKKLFTMSLNQLSETHEGRDALSVVRVIDRKEAGRQPFKEVQEEIRSIMTEEQNKNRPKKLLKELFTQAVIETQYSLPQFVPAD